MTRAAAALLWCLLVLTAGLSAGQSLQVTPLTREGRVLVSFKLSDAFSEALEAAIHCGLTISFVYEVDIRRSAARRASSGARSASPRCRRRCATITSRAATT